MGDIGTEELMNWEKLQGMEHGKEEKILVLVRLRPLSEKEIAQGEVAEWECINSTTILCRNSLQERPVLPTAYSFDRVFKGDCTTREVYEKGAKDIALSVVGGINSTIFAYGQTSSGKTYTMNGVTEHAIADIYDYIQRHEERAFSLKFSAIEIYNEVVRDLLGSDNTPLRLLDDPERGTIVEKLTEETLRDQNHLKELLSICEAQRQIGETSLNETSSRSHQILRLTIESSAREFLGKSNSTALAASVNFVDLAGSERASQASSVGQRLKEGCHINRSLLTLGTVIRKLSTGRHGHVNYRDSKLTRILQPALGGNARTAIICTLCPSRIQIEQSRNTLLFASCAKEVSTNAHVNIVMSDKALVKHLQKEVARLEGAIRTPSSACDHASMLRKKDVQIEQMEKVVNDLKNQLGFAQTRIENLSKAAESYEMSQNGDFSTTSDISQGIGNDEDYDDICKEVRCVEIDESGKESTSKSFGFSTLEEEPLETLTEDVNDHILALPMQDENSYSTQHQGNSDVPKAMTSPMEPCSYTSSTGMAGLGNFKLVRSQSCRDNLMTSLPGSVMTEHTPSSVFEKSFTGRPEGGFLLRKQLELPHMVSSTNSPKETRINSPISDSSSVVDDIPTLGSFVAGLRELAKLQNENQATTQVQETRNKDDNSGRDSRKFEMLQKSIIELWHDCYVPLIHRTYFVLLVKNDSSDSIYMEVEHRRLSFLKDTFSRDNSAVVQDGRTLTLASSKKAVDRERRMLSKLMLKRYTQDERTKLYNEWGINLRSKKRRLQLAHLIWSEAKSLEHVQKSATIVAKLVGLSERELATAPKEMFGLSFAHRPSSRRSFIHSMWKS